ncbi:hypothetical protein P3W66_11830 [Achromobacter denitrificans]|uniref:hypothetical protein n=1 Tax=Achromobacter denitrificans TaxID=32002 RepID=UPI0023E7FD88|nr:hypothetical protein [Achromobacter denitrificans]MDF3940723.1 hypothetical protein [Achromobacter denitrificans]
MTTMTVSRLPTAPAVAVKAEPLFPSAHAALVFALNYSMQQYDRPLMNRIASGELTAGMAPGGGKGLSGLDGAGQAGMIRAELARLKPIEKAVLVAHAAPSQLPCACGVPCCSGWKTNPEWQDAMSVLNTAAASGALSGCVSNGRLRSALIQRLFGARLTLAELAERYSVDDKTASAHHAKLKRWLFGGSDQKGVGLHQQAYRALSARLAACRWISEADEA